MVGHDVIDSFGQIGFDQNDWNHNSGDYNFMDPQALQVASGWADGSLHFSEDVSFFDWADENIGLDPVGFPVLP